MRPRITKAKLRGGFLGDEFVGCFNDRAKWITQLAGVFPVGVVNSPELLAGLQSRNRFHGDSSPQTAFAKMYQLHKMRAQSEQCPQTQSAYRCPGRSQAIIAKMVLNRLNFAWTKLA